MKTLTIGMAWGVLLLISGCSEDPVARGELKKQGRRLAKVERKQDKQFDGLVEIKRGQDDLKDHIEKGFRDISSPAQGTGYLAGYYGLSYTPPHDNQLRKEIDELKEELKKLQSEGGDAHSEKRKEEIFRALQEWNEMEEAARREEEKMRDKISEAARQGAADALREGNQEVIDHINGVRDNINAHTTQECGRLARECKEAAEAHLKKTERMVRNNIAREGTPPPLHGDRRIYVRAERIQYPEYRCYFDLWRWNGTTYYRWYPYCH